MTEPEPQAGARPRVLVAETLALDLDPYPRKPGEAFPGHVEDDGAEAKAPSPFAVLADKKGS